MMSVNETNYVDKAEEVIKKLEDNRDKITTSKIRSILSMVSDIYNEVISMKSEKLDQDIVSRIDYLRVRCVYDAGRDRAVKKFMEEADILNILKQIGDSKSNYLIFSRYMEALVAFHKFYKGE